MPTNTPDQQITIPIGTDLADNPQAFIDMIADVETRLVLKYTNEADRTARHTAPIEGDLTDLATENRQDVYNGANYVSAHTRGFFNYVSKSASQTLNNTAVLTNDTELFTALPTAGIFGWQCVIFHDSSTTADAKFAWTIPAGATMRWGIHGLASTATGTTGDGQFNVTTVSGTALTLGGAGVGATVMALMEGEVTMGGTAGNLQLQWAQNVAEVSDIRVLHRSRMMVWRSA